MRSDRSAVILAGGQGRRMGGVNKALLRLGGERLLERQVREAAKWSDEVIVVTNDPFPLLQELGVRVVPDVYRGEGPLAGLHAGLSATTRRYVWVFACDQPYPSAEAAELLLRCLLSEGVEAALSVIDGRDQPLHAVYRQEVAVRTGDLLASGVRRLNDLLSDITWVQVAEERFANSGIPVGFTSDIDTPEQYERAAAFLRQTTPKEEQRLTSSFTPHSPERFRRSALQPDEAQRRLIACASTLPEEKVSLTEAWGRTLAQSLIAPHPFPPFRRSAMDGYAVRAEDLIHATPEKRVGLEVVESLPGGTAPTQNIGTGQASRVMTGGMIPDGANTVVMLEMTEVSETNDLPVVTIGRSVAKGTNVAEIGSEIVQGAEVLQAGRMIGAGESALLASFGCAEVYVRRRPKVGILSTGSELLDVSDPLAPAKIRNSNAPMLAVLVRESGAEPIMLGQVPDEAVAARALIDKGLHECDLLLTSGGVSVGDYDVIVDVLATPDIELLFNKVAMRPGSPTTAAIVSGKPLIALSGNPGACFVGFHLFAAPVLRVMLGQSSDVYGEKFQAYLGADFPKVNAYRRYIRASTEFKDGTIWVTPTGDDKSSLMTTIVGADCLIEIPPLKEGLAKGHLVTALKL
ncbi:gephyrin-like molybdotransferase Glp [Cohnella soli]|uniref:Probable molybdenum cofactor guanylyltransferase n=1 Tax=Cohnella soli TaxID=425005 RepID=A0ABW0HXE5_9BACL